MRLQSIVLMGMLAIGILSSVAIPQLAHADESTSFVNVDISQTANPNDQPFAISCDPSAVYMTIYQQGMLAKIDPVSKNVTLIQSPSGGGNVRGFYSMTRDSNGNYWINERNSGRIWEYDPSGNGTWTSIPTLPELTGAAISYPLGYQDRPDSVRVDTGTSGFHSFGFGLNNFGDLIFANGEVMMGLSYDMDFDDASHAVGVEDQHFAGIVTIDPDTRVLTAHSIAGAVGPTGLSLDNTDNNVVWITDPGTGQVYKYNLLNNSVDETYTLPANSFLKGVANDSDNVYVAMTRDRHQFPDTNSTIMKIEKSSGTQTEMDTGAPNTNSGTFSVYVVNGFLIWTDLSGHVGSINLTDGAKTHVDTVFANENHFGCQLGDDFWVAGHGSVKAGIFSMSELSPTKPAPVSENQQTIKALFIDPVQTILDNCKNMTIESASQPYDYFHHGTRAWAEYMQFQSVLATQTDPNLKNLTELQKSWLFEKVKPELDEVFGWINDA